MLVHFPIVLLLGAAVLRSLTPLLSENNASFFNRASRLCLVIGVITAWITVYTGSLADSIVVRELCDPTVLERHENGGYTIAVLFSIAAVLDLGVIRFLPEQKQLVKKFTEWTVIVLLLAGSGYVAYTAHLGASLVYQQGAAVHVPSAGCSEFE